MVQSQKTTLVSNLAAPKRRLPPQYHCIQTRKLCCSSLVQAFVNYLYDLSALRTLVLARDFLVAVDLAYQAVANSLYRRLCPVWRYGNTGHWRFATQLTGVDASSTGNDCVKHESQPR